MKQIFIFSEFYFPDLLSSGYYVTEISEHLAKKYPVTVVCVSDVRNTTRETCNEVNIIRLPDPGLDKNNLIKRSLRFVKISQSFAHIGRKLINPGDLVICLTNPAFSIIAFGILKKKINFRFIIFVHDVFPENLVGAGILSSGNPIYRALIKVFKKAYSRADHIVTCGRDMKAIFQEKLPFFSGEITYIPNWGDQINILPEFNGNQEIRKRFHLEDKFVVQFAGNLGRAQGIHIILEAAKRISDQNIVFLFFGTGVMTDQVKEHAAGSANVIYGGVFHRKESILFLHAADIALVSLSKGMKGLGVPSKTFNIMASAKPILYIGEEDSEIALMVKEENIGSTVMPDSVDELVRGINYFRHLGNEELKNMGERARQALIEKYSREAILEQYSVLFSKIESC